MKLIERARIEAPAEAIWKYVGDPELWPGFHPKIARVERRAGPGPGSDAWYDLDYQMGERTLRHRARVVEYDPPRRIVLEATCTFDRAGSPREVRVEICQELKPRGDATELVETHEIDGHGMPWPVTLLVTLIQRFGRRVGPSGAEQLQRLMLESP